MIKHLFFIIISIIVFTYLLLWAFSFKTYNVQYGVSFSPEYTAGLGLDPKTTFDSIINDLHPQYIRLAIPWSFAEQTRGTYDFSDIDYFISQAGLSGAKVVLVVGQKVPRWPECYIPDWTDSFSQEEYKKALLEYVQTSVERYKDNSAIELWQVENEPFIRFPFGECARFDKTAIYDEVQLVKEIDPFRQVVITDSGELSTWRRPSFLGDVFGTTLYRTTRTFKDWVVSYDVIPPAFYKVRARLWGNGVEHFFVSELQAEPWFVEGVNPQTADYASEKTFTPKRFKQNIEYSQKVGASRVYLWGVEWWYFMKEKKADTRYWDFAKSLFESAR